MARWAGRVANLRMYARALSADDVRAVMAEDQLALASFRQSYPVDVAVYDDQTDQPVLSITNDAAGRTRPLVLYPPSAVRVPLDVVWCDTC